MFTSLNTIYARFNWYIKHFKISDQMWEGKLFTNYEMWLMHTYIQL